MKPIVHMSRSLLPAEKNYSQIKKEGLAIIYAIKKFHRFIHGRSFILQTTHKPLLVLFGSKKRNSIAYHKQTSEMEYYIIQLRF